MITRTFLLVVVISVLNVAPAWAGPPLICHAGQIGVAPSLPWQDTGGWNGMVPSYNVSHLASDTLQLLGRGVPVITRMETLRRAAIYTSRQPELAGQLADRLLARAQERNAGALAFFDIGFFAEAVRQAVVAFSMLHDPSEQSAWHLRTDPLRIDGSVWLAKAMRSDDGRVRQAAAQTLAAVRR